MNHEELALFRRVADRFFSDQPTSYLRATSLLSFLQHPLIGKHPLIGTSNLPLLDYQFFGSPMPKKLKRQLQALDGPYAETVFKMLLARRGQKS